jgi:orotidine-5'-phosphate decarboxylase
MTTTHLSAKAIPPDDRLIFALDYESNDQAKQIVETLGDAVNFYKIGLEMFMGGQYFEMLDWLTGQGKQVFVDLKFFDVPQTVGSAVRQLRDKGATFATVHGNDAKILAVTVLTSLDRGDLQDLGFPDVDVEALVLSRAKRAFALGCDGVISSGLEAKALRSSLGENFLVVTPGIRPVDNRADDQKRTVNVEQAFSNGADYIVVGRPIKLAPDPYAAACQFRNQIRKIFAAP